MEVSRGYRAITIDFDFQEGFQYSPEGLAKATAPPQEFLRDLYRSLGAKERRMLFGVTA